MTDTIESLRAQHAELGRRIEALERAQGRAELAAQAMRKLRLWADEDVAAHNSNEYPPGFRCHVGGAITGAPVGPSFATPGSRDRAQAALTAEELEALA